MAKFSFSKIKLEQEPSLREKVFFGLALGGVLILFVNVLWTPLSDSTRAIAKEQKTVELQAEALRKLVEATSSQMALQTSGSKQQAPVDAWVKRVLDRRITDIADETTATVDQLGSRSIARRVKVQKIEVGDRVEAPAYVMVPVKIDVTGPYTGLQSYLDVVERLERPLVIRTMDLRQSDEPGVLAVLLEAELYIPKR